MPQTLTLHLHAADGRTHRITGRAGQSLMQAAVDAGIEAIVAECGGGLTCATCHVFVAEPWRGLLPPPDADEQAMLELTAVPARPGSRLGCQVRLDPKLDGLEAHLPERQY